MPGLSPEYDSAEIQHLLDAQTSGTTVLVPSEAAARDLRSRFNAHFASSRVSSWTPARILTWEAWTRSLYSGLISSGVESRMLLNAVQEHALWCDVIGAAPGPDPLDSTASLASMAMSAWALAADYEALAELRRFAVTYDARTFALWAGAFRSRCAEGRFLSASELSTALRTHIHKNSFAPPHSLLLLGFPEDQPPARRSLLQAMSDLGTQVRRETAESDHKSSFQIIQCKNIYNELFTSCKWIYNFSKKTDREGGVRKIAVIVPQLDEERDALEVSLREALCPELEDVSIDPSAAPFDFSTGLPLAKSALISTALLVLRWLAAPLGQGLVREILLSPYVGNGSDLPARAAFDASRLHAAPRLRPELSLSDARSACAAKDAPAAKKSLRFLDAIHDVFSVNSGKNSTYSGWVEVVREVLAAANWPGDRALNAQEFAAAQAWDHVLDSVATLDFLGRKVSYLAALEAIERQARAVTVPAVQSNALVEVMRPSEAAGRTFDAILFLHATDANLPTAQRPNPFLSWKLQRERRMPGADPALTSARAAEAVAALRAATPQAFFFYETEDENGPQRLSPVIAALGLPEVAAEDLVPPTLPLPPLATDAIADDSALPGLPSSAISGGARVLKLQAACGFLAFSELRLHSAALDTVTTGFDALESGNFLHRSMQAVWRELKSQDELRRLSLEQRDALLRRAIESSVSRHIHAETDWDRAYLQLQKDRLLVVLRGWLGEELKRGPFTVLGLEQQTEVSVGPLTLSVRMDRIDKVEGGYVLVDYKTGASAHPAHWNTERPEDPQLPLYSLVLEPDELRGLAFARVRAGKSMAWLGVQAEAGILPMKRPETTDLELAIEEWRHHLTHLADDFASGRATVSPRDFAVDCSRCAQRLLCRVNPEALLASSDEPGEEDAE